MMATNLSDRQARLIAAVDRHGVNLGAWSDEALAKETRAALLADRRLRAYFEDAVALEDGLLAARAALDAEIEASGAAERVSAMVLARRPPRRRARQSMRWIAAAAAIVIAAGLGSVVDITLVAPSEQTSQEVVLLDPLIFGSTEVGVQ
jgi:hypothetical protein